MAFNLLWITLIIVFIIDISGFIDFVKDRLARWLGVKSVSIKPFDCSLCSTWWSGLIYLAVIGKFTLANIALVAGFALMAMPLSQIILMVRDAIIALIDKLWKNI